MTSMAQILLLERLKDEIRWGASTYAGALGRLSIHDHQLRAHLAEQEKSVLEQSAYWTKRIDELITEEVTRRD